MSYNIKVEADFSAAHYLKGYRGKCENLHGHNWKVEAVISSSILNSTGMVFDFKEAKSLLNKALGIFDHKDLNKITAFKKKNPTSELIAEFIFNKYEKKLKKGLKLESISVWETPTSSATFFKE